VVAVVDGNLQPIQQLLPYIKQLTMTSLWRSPGSSWGIQVLDVREALLNRLQTAINNCDRDCDVPRLLGAEESPLGRRCRAARRNRSLGSCGRR
jgi:hypothetical protein